jgi:hypothetical protein
MIRAIKSEEIPILVDLHLKVLPESIQAKFGRRFVRLFYDSLLSDPEFYCDGFFWENQMIGFVSYSPRPWKVLHRALVKKIFVFAGVLFLSVIGKPKRLAILAKIAPIFFRLRPEPAKKDEAEGINWGVLPDYRRSAQFYKETGIHVASEIFKHFVEANRNLNVKRIKIMPLSDDPATAGFLHKHNWKFEGKINRWGTLLDVYAKDLDQQDMPN